jgi:chromosome segregation ATPase
MAGDIEKQIKEMMSTLDRLEKQIGAELNRAEKAAKSLGGVKFESQARLEKAQDTMSKVWKQANSLDASSPPPEVKKAYKAVESVEADFEDARQRLDKEITAAQKEDKQAGAATQKAIDDMKSDMSRVDKQLMATRSELEKMRKKAAAFPDLLSELDRKELDSVDKHRIQIQKVVDSLSVDKLTPADVKKASAMVEDVSDEADDIGRRTMRDIADVEKDLKARS